ncbi:nitrogen fixation protein NifQ [Ectothiorhodospiraceae bacterium BW-2]|nr:nitrogen fixation protein NifQ [Ectothiorhodospiraceae bacterium BW-2]
MSLELNQTTFQCENGALAAVVLRQQLYQQLMQHRRGELIEESLALMIASLHGGSGAMPAWLGLGEGRYQHLIASHFPALDLSQWPPQPPRPVDLTRRDEWQEVLTLLHQGRSGDSEAELWLAEIVAIGCQANDHLWSDLGLWSRADLSTLMVRHFRPLAERNSRDMKWKRFLYKQLCEAEGIYTCRAPSCEICTDYANCFNLNLKE